MTKYRHTIRNWEMDDAKPDPPKTCAVSGKRMYPTQGEANATAAHQMTNRESAPAQLRTYKCLYCGSWHLTSRGA